MQKKLPVGVSDFKEIIEKDHYFIDKSLFLKELIDDGSKTILLTRPRRFGKTMNLSMARYFFERNEEDTGALFQDLAIWKQGERYRAEHGRYPVIYLTFKDVKVNNWTICYEKIMKIIAKEFVRHHDLLFTKLSVDEQAEYTAIIKQTASTASYQNSLLDLSSYLANHTEQKVMILIDEYDTPIQAGYLHGYYDEALEFMRNLLGAGLKDNSSLQKGVLTGILRMAKENIFSDLNHIRVCSMTTTNYSAQFGLLETEVQQLLQDCAIDVEPSKVRHWYNGYSFGDTTIYNPWSIIHFAKENGRFANYWVNTSGNDLVRHLLTRGDGEIKEELEQLLRDGSIRKKVDENLLFRHLEHRSDALWTLFLFSGYLKATQYDDETNMANLAIPNREVATVYHDIVNSWFMTRLSDRQYQLMLRSLVTGDSETFEDIFQDFVKKSMSMFDPAGDEPERVYHAFVLGMLLGLPEYEVRSNRESGYGRYDVMLIPKSRKQKAVIIEFKKKRREATLSAACAVALAQIEAQDYASELVAMGCTDIMKLGIAFEGKHTMIQVGD